MPNNRTIASAVALLAMLATAPASAADKWTITEDGAGPVRLGMSLQDAARVAGTLAPREAPFGEACEYRAPADAPASLGFMFQHGRLVRIETDKRGVANQQGLRVGDAEDKIAPAYRGRTVKVSAHPYLDDQGHYVEIPAKRSDRHWIFETDKGVVSNLRIGFNHPVDFIEGCS